jgi:hypothetical protein
MRLTVITIIMFILSAAILKAQTRYTEQEGIDFYNAVRQTAEYKRMKNMIDAYNADSNNIPQKMKFEVTYSSDDPPDDIILKGSLTRRLSISMGLPLESCLIKYDRKKKAIVSIHCNENAKLK